MLFDPRHPAFLAALDCWITRPAPEPRSLCECCGEDCTDTEHAVTAAGADRLGVDEHALVCSDCERDSRAVSL